MSDNDIKKELEQDIDDLARKLLPLCARHKGVLLAELTDKSYRNKNNKLNNVIINISGIIFREFGASEVALSLTIESIRKMLNIMKDDL